VIDSNEQRWIWTAYSLESAAMDRVLLGLICGLVFGIVDILIMLPMEFPDKKTALLGAFLDRFAIGFVIGCVRLGWPAWLIGLTFGLLISLPSAVITKAYAPILILGAIGGILIGLVVGAWGSDPKSEPLAAPPAEAAAGSEQKLNSH
jgi:hypothetical protein